MRDWYSRDVTRRIGPAVLAIVCIGWLVVIATWSALHLTMTVDDTYYYFKTARNFAHGLGSTFDGVEPTNGYHPLWFLLLACLAKVGPSDMVAFTRTVLALQVLLVGAAGWFLGKLPNGGSRAQILLALALLNPFSAKIVLCGQETALQLFLSCVLVVMFWTWRSAPSLKRSAALGGIAVLVTLARLDGAFLSGIALVMPVIAPSEEERATTMRARIERSAVGLGILGAAIVAYCIFNKVYFGHFLPVSGAIKAKLDADEVLATPGRIVVVLIGLGGLAYVLRWANKHPDGPAALLAPPLGAGLLLFIYNQGIRGEASPKLIRIWYLEPYLFAGAVALEAIAPRARAWVDGRGARSAERTESRLGGFRGRSPLSAIAGVVVVGWFGFTAMTWRYRVEPRSYSVYEGAERCSRWFDKNGEPGAIAAAWDAGFAAAFTEKPVMNLDGLINSWRFKEEFLDPGRLDDFVFDDHPTGYIIQYAWPWTIRAIAKRFKDAPLPTTPLRHATVGGPAEGVALTRRWGVDVTPYSVAHVECVMVSVAYAPGKTEGPVYYFVLSRTPMEGRPTLAEFALAHDGRESCE
jgi:hypothetical protein